MVISFLPLVFSSPGAGLEKSDVKWTREKAAKAQGLGCLTFDISESIYSLR